VYRRAGCDVLFPTQEQVAVLAASAERLRSARVRTAVPPSEALARVQDKVAAFATLRGVGLPQPGGAVVSRAADLARVDKLPVFVKTAIGTATSGVRHVTDAADLRAAAAVGVEVVRVVRRRQLRPHVRRLERHTRPPALAGTRAAGGGSR
jgi:biotin carboxylase